MVLRGRAECSRFALDFASSEYETRPVGFEHSPAQPANVRNPKTRPKAADSRRARTRQSEPPQRRALKDASANKKPALAEGDRGFFESGEGGIRTHE
jgi:hypothetical protein